MPAPFTLLRLALLVGLVSLTSCGDAERLRWGPGEKPAATAEDKVAPEAEANEPKGPWVPDVKAASPAAERAMAGFTIGKGLKIRLVAAEPQLANPVGMTIDHQGRIYVAECHRRNSGGCADNRDHDYWVDDDLAAQTVEDRRRFTLKHHPEFAEEWTRGSEYVRMLVDEDGDGVVDRSTVFSDRHNDLLSGTAADCFFHDGQVWFACIPHMWRLADEDGDGVAEKAEKLFSGFGVRYALRGHDLHGMVRGPDGRIYFSIGDRGYDIRTLEGERLAAPHTGAVFRCEPDGSELEIFATGLRNPQDLAFDDLGHLVTGDNNSDSDDKARILYVVEGGETGWRMNFQYKSRRGPWVREDWWKPRFENQAAFLIPPVANLGAGPSGLVHNPGAVLSENYSDQFFLCDFRGSRKVSGVRSFRLEPNGAGLRLVEDGWLVKGFLPTDLDFGPDGELYLCDWVSGWDGPGRGRIYAMRDEKALATNAAREAAELLSRPNLHGLPSERLVALLAHPHRLVRQRAQFALVLAEDGRVRLAARARDTAAARQARIQAIWGLGQLGRRDASLAADLLPLLDDDLAEIRAQTARVLAEIENADVRPALRDALRDKAPRVQYFAAMALGAHRDAAAFDGILALLESNADRDLYLRHAGVMAWTRIGDADRLASDAVAGHSSRAVRLGALLALRRLGDARVARFLNDRIPFLAVEAARAIHDQPISKAWPALAAKLSDASAINLGEAFLRRAISAADLLSRPEDAGALASLAANEASPIAMRVEALEALATWPDNPPHDRVLKDHRPRPTRGVDDVRNAGISLGALPITSKNTDLRRASARVCGAFGLVEQAKVIADWLDDPKVNGRLAREALDALDRLDRDATDENTSSAFAKATDAALRAADGSVRGHAAGLLAKREPAAALPILKAALARNETAETQLVYRTLADMNHAEADAILAEHFGRFTDGDLDPSRRLDLVEAVEARAEAGAAGLSNALATWNQDQAAERRRNPMALWSLALYGGDAERGRKLFAQSKSDCARCHAVTVTDKTMAGPSLHDVGKKRGRSFILESIVAPNRSIHPDYRQVVVETKDKRVLVGRLLEESSQGLSLEINHNDKRFERIDLRASQIASKRATKSAMPEDITTRLSRREIRDLVSYLLTLNQP